MFDFAGNCFGNRMLAFLKSALETSAKIRSLGAFR
ncbi:hypothetical protein A2U01_0117062, partial [Trifolium medium]|nr:hypothetical protein [Trifolium medium]